MADAHSKNHDYHIIDPSPWPFLGSVGAFVMAIGGIAYMRYLAGGSYKIFGVDIANPYLFFIGLVLVLYTMFGWWSDTVKEANEGHHTRVVSLHLRYGMIMFIASEVMFFVAWFWAFFDASLYAFSMDALLTLVVSGHQRALKCSIRGICQSITL